MRLVFDDCVLDLDRRELHRASRVVTTAPQVFDLLVYLTQNRERVVSRNDLIHAIWAGRIISESTLATHINAVRKAVGDNGRQQSVIRTVPRKGFRFVVDVREVRPRDRAVLAGDESSRSVQPSAATPPLPTKPSIAVLPFVNLSGNDEQDYLADGVVGDIIAALSQYRWLFVVARNSSFTYKARMVDVKQIGRELGVRYVLEGSWRKAKNRVRITAQLIDATSGAHHWAGRFESVLDDIFALQDQITESVVSAIAPQLERAETERTKHKPTENLDAYDYYLRAMAKLHHGTRETSEQALPLFYKAMEFGPDFASAYAMAAWCYCWRKANRWLTEGSGEIAEGIRLARRALELGRDDAVVLSRSGHVLAYLAGDLQAGIALLDKALMLNPNLAVAWFLGGFLKLWRGETDAAIHYLTHVIRLSPFDPELYRMQAGMALAHLFVGRVDTALSWAQKATRDLPGFLLAVTALAASQALAGQKAQAQRAMDQLRQLDPTLRLSNLTDWLPIQQPENLATLVDALRKAGLPE